MALNNMVNIFDLKSNNYENCSTESELTFTYLYSVYKLSLGGLKELQMKYPKRRINQTIINTRTHTKEKKNVLI